MGESKIPSESKHKVVMMSELPVTGSVISLADGQWRVVNTSLGGSTSGKHYCVFLELQPNKPLTLAQLKVLANEPEPRREGETRRARLSSFGAGDIILVAKRSPTHRGLVWSISCEVEL